MKMAFEQRLSGLREDRRPIPGIRGDDDHRRSARWSAEQCAWPTTSRMSSSARSSVHGASTPTPTTCGSAWWTWARRRAHCRSSPARRISTEGDLVPGRAGTTPTLPGGVHITAGKLRGVESERDAVLVSKSWASTVHDLPRRPIEDGIVVLTTRASRDRRPMP